MKKRIRELENKRMDFEIKGKRVRTAAFSYSLILLLSLLAPTAQAAKLCAKSETPLLTFGINSNPGAWMWAIGSDCISAQIEDPTGLCPGGVTAFGYGVCGSDNTGNDCKCVACNGTTSCASWWRQKVIKSFPTNADCKASGACKTLCATAMMGAYGLGDLMK
jgi:hypothetical protein